MALDDKQWLRRMLAHAAHLLTQIRDQVDVDDVTATTGPDCDPDKYDVDGFLAAVRERYPEM